MKRISTLILLVAGILAFASCDKIEKDQYTIFAGAAGSWYDSDVEPPHVQRAFIEKYTGVRCINCPKADEVIHAASDKYGDSVVVVAVHSRSTGFGRPLGNDPSLCTEYGDEWYDFFGIAAQPAAMINRQQAGGTWDLFTPTSNFDDRIEAVVNAEPELAMSIKNGAENEHYSDIYVEFLKEGFDELTLTLLITQDKIYTRQSKQGEGEVENYEQNHVLRTVITNLWGFPVPNNLPKGSKKMIRFYYQLPDGCTPADCHAVAFISHKDSRQIINCAETDLK